MLTSKNTDEPQKMNWFVLALISSITLSLREFFIKKNSGGISSTFMSWAMNFINFFLFLALNIVSGNQHPITGSFFGVLITAAFMDSLAMVLYLWAIKNGQLSRIIPMLCFIPVVQLFVAPFLVKENLSLAGAAGVLIVVGGSYIQNMNNWQHILAPFKGIITSKSSLMMLAAAGIWGVSSSLHKIGIRQTDALFWAVSEAGCISLFLFPLAWKAKRRNRAFKKLKQALLPSIFSTITLLTYFMALGLGPVAYVSSLRRLGVLFSMLAGVILFGERLPRIGFIGGIIMIAGAIIISIFG